MHGYKHDLLAVTFCFVMSPCLL